MIFVCDITATKTYSNDEIVFQQCKTTHICMIFNETLNDSFILLYSVYFCYEFRTYVTSPVHNKIQDKSEG